MLFKLTLKKKRNLQLKGNQDISQPSTLEVVTLTNGRKVVFRTTKKYDVAVMRERAARHKTFLRKRASELTTEALQTRQGV